MKIYSNIHDSNVLKENEKKAEQERLQAALKRENEKIDAEKKADNDKAKKKKD